MYLKLRFPIQVSTRKNREKRSKKRLLRLWFQVTQRSEEAVHLTGIKDYCGYSCYDELRYCIAIDKQNDIYLN